MKNKTAYICFYLTVSFMCSFFVKAQERSRFPFYLKTAEIEFKDTKGQVLSFPGSGGMNSVHLADLDLNGDGVDDVLLFDKIGDHLSCFLINERGDWEYAPEYIPFLPPLKSWLKTYDYDGDGDMDIFSFNGVSGIRVYKNISEGANLKFQEQTSAISVKMFGQKLALYCPGVDFPAFVDIDKDGDMDILSFWVPTAGDFLHYYRNRSQEDYGHSDSLVFEHADPSWGCFLEHEESNKILLDTCAPSLENSFAAFSPKHTGSTLLALENPQTASYDLLLADIGFPNICHLKNTGSLEKPKISSYDTAFPLENPVNLYTFPVLSVFSRFDESYLVASPFGNNPFAEQGKESVWRYQIKNEEGVYRFSLVEKDFLQAKTIDLGSGAYPCLVDITGDGLQDLLIGSYGEFDSAYFYYGAYKTTMYARMSFYENIGSKERPIFQERENDFAGLSKLKARSLHPTAADINGDGLAEIIVGTEEGKLWLLKRNESKQYAVVDTFYKELIFGPFSAPTLFDLDKDGLLDLVLGERRKTWDIDGKRRIMGGLTWYRNIGSAEEAVFTKMTDSLGSVDVRDPRQSNYAYSRPYFYRDSEGKTFLYCGAEDGYIYVYDSIDDNLNGKFRFCGRQTWQIASKTYALDVGSHSAPAVYDLNDDGLADMLIGNQRGGIHLYWGSKDVINKIEDSPNKMTLSVLLYPNPSKEMLCIKTNFESGVYTIYNSIGQRLERKELKSKEENISIKNLKNGLYILRIEYKNQIINTKFSVLN